MQTYPRMMAEHLSRAVAMALDFSDDTITCRRAEQNEMAKIGTSLENV